MRTKRHIQEELRGSLMQWHTFAQITRQLHMEIILKNCYLDTKLKYNVHEIFVGRKVPGFISQDLDNIMCNISKLGEGCRPLVPGSNLRLYGCILYCVLMFVCGRLYRGCA